MNDEQQGKFDELVIGLKHESAAVRVESLHQLSTLGNCRAIPSVVWMMGDESLWVRCSAAETLGNCRHIEAVEPLVQFLRLGAKDELARHGAPDETPIRVHRFERISDPLYDAWAVEQSLNTTQGFNLAVSSRIGLHRIGVESARAMVALLGDENPYVAYVAVQVLRPMCMRRSVGELLIDALQDDVATVRAHAALAMGRAGNFGAVEVLIAALADEALTVRVCAAESLGVIGDARAVEPLRSLLADEATYSAGWLALSSLGASVQDDEGDEL